MASAAGCAAREPARVEPAPVDGGSPPVERADVIADETLRRAAEAAYMRARAALLDERQLEAGTIWNLRQGLEHRPDPELAALLDVRAEALTGTRYERLVNPEAPRIELPEELGTGIERMTRISMAPLGRPEERAVTWLVEYVANDASGYTLTHQFLYILWGEATGLEFPETVRERKRSLLLRVAAEQAAASRFSDLWAERAALLMLYSRPSTADVQRWIGRVVDHQLANGYWDSQGSDAGDGNYHTTGLCMAALMVYLGDDAPASVGRD